MERYSVQNQGRLRRFSSWQEPAVQPETTVGGAKTHAIYERQVLPARCKGKGLVHLVRNSGGRRIKHGHENAGCDWRDFPNIAGGHALESPRRCPPGWREAWSDVSRHLLPGHCIQDMTAATRFLKKLRRHEKDPCLYIYPFNVPSLVVHFTIVLALRAKLRPSRDLSHLGYRLVNIEKHDNLREWYLVEVNALGRVRCFILKLWIGGNRGAGANSNWQVAAVAIDGRPVDRLLGLRPMSKSTAQGASNRDMSSSFSAARNH